MFQAAAGGVVNEYGILCCDAVLVEQGGEGVGNGLGTAVAACAADDGVRRQFQAAVDVGVVGRDGDDDAADAGVGGKEVKGVL